MVKKRSPSVNQNFVVEISLEEAMQRLQQVGDYGLQIAFTEVDHKLTLFESRHWYAGGKYVSVRGRLRRWQGTSTRVQFDWSLADDRVPIMIGIVTIGVSALLWAITTSWFLVALALGLGLIAWAFVPSLLPATQQRHDSRWMIYMALQDKLEPSPQVLHID